MKVYVQTQKVSMQIHIQKSVLVSQELNHNKHLLFIHPTSYPLFWQQYKFSDNNSSKLKVLLVTYILYRELNNTGDLLTCLCYIASALRTRFRLLRVPSTLSGTYLLTKSLVQCSAPSGHPVKIN